MTEPTERALASDEEWDDPSNATMDHDDWGDAGTGNDDGWDDDDDDAMNNNNNNNNNNNSNTDPSHTSSSSTTTAKNAQSSSTAKSSSSSGWDDDDDDMNANPSSFATSSSSSSTATTATASTVDASFPQPVPMQRANSYIPLNELSLTAQMKSLIAQTADVLFLTPDEAGALLRSYGWKTRKVHQEWFEDQQKVRDSVGITSADDFVPATTQLVQCQTAYCDEFAITDVHALNCGHYFCTDCWTGYLESQIRAGPGCIMARCMGMRCTKNHAHKFGCACQEMVPESYFTRFVKDETLSAKYTRWLLNSFVEGQRSIKWCPRPGCDFAVMYNGGGTKSVRCQCGHDFCFLCREVGHTPAPCDLVAKWLAREKSDDATTVWLNARTKECPKCQVRIEKNKACNHMTCTKCNHGFCWLCKGPWASHGSATGGYYVCNKYENEVKAGKLTSEEKTIQSSQRLLQKYMYYYNRFKDSIESIEFTYKLRTRLERLLAAYDLSHYMYVMDAIDKMIAARRVVQWTYCLAYYLRSGGSKHLFEYQQDLLCNCLESLQDLLEHAADVQRLVEQRKEIINKTSSLDKFRAEMVAQIERGDFEDVLLADADEDMESWGCSNCSKTNKRDQAFCTKCDSCRLHGEAECKACRPPKK